MLSRSAARTVGEGRGAAGTLQRVATALPPAAAEDRRAPIARAHLRPPFAGPAASSPPTTATLNYLTHCLEPSAHGMPRCDVFPLLPFQGWTPQRVAALADAEEVVAAAERAKECHALLDELNAARQAAGLPSLSLTLTAGYAEAGDGSSSQQQAQQGPDQPAAQQQGDGQAAAEAAAPVKAVAAGVGAAAEQQAAEPAGPAGPCSRVIGDWPHPHLQFAKVGGWQPWWGCGGFSVLCRASCRLVLLLPTCCGESPHLHGCLLLLSLAAGGGGRHV